MLGKYLIVGAMALTITGAAQAGTLTFADGHGTWQSTMCTHPTRPASLPADPELAANDLNEQVTAYNLYTGQIQAYMECLSREAERDISGAQQTVSGTAHKTMKDAQDELLKIQAQLQHQQK